MLRGRRIRRRTERDRLVLRSRLRRMDHRNLMFGLRTVARSRFIRARTAAANRAVGIAYIRSRPDIPPEIRRLIASYL